MDVPPAAGPVPPASGTSVSGGEPRGDRTLAAVAYLLTLLTGLLVLVLAKRDDRYARFHAAQAIGLGLVILVVGLLLSFASVLLFAGTATTGDPSSFGAIFSVLWTVGMLWNLVWILLVLFLAFRAYEGRGVRLPVLAAFADRLA